MTPSAAVRLPFWSDDFDMDLLKVFPQAETMIRDPGAILWTVGHTSDGRLNHPSVWNTHGAFVWLEKPNLERDKHGWFNVHGCVSDEPEIECTWLEWLRDAWVHSYGSMILPSMARMPAAPANDFTRIMYDQRGWRKADVSDSRKAGLHWIMRCDLIFSSLADPLSQEPRPATLREKESLK